MIPTSPSKGICSLLISFLYALTYKTELLYSAGGGVKNNGRKLKMNKLLRAGMEKKEQGTLNRSVILRPWMNSAGIKREEKQLQRKGKV